MKLKDLMDMIFTNDDTLFTVIDVAELDDYLDGSDERVIFSLPSNFEIESFVKDSILNAEVTCMGMKSDEEIVFHLSSNWNKKADNKEKKEIVDVRCPSKAVDVSVTKNEFGLSDVTIKDLKEEDMIKLLTNICLQFDVSGIIDKDGKWSHSFDEEGDNDGES